MGVGTLVQRAVFLDRDGVINQAVVRNGKPYPPASVAEMAVTEGAEAALAALKEAGFRLLVVTNQPDVARGQQTQAAVEAINERLMATLPLDQVYTCYHDEGQGCQCRKPLPGLILQAASDWQIDVATSFLVGDRWKDVAAGRSAGCTTLLIDMHYAEPEPVAPDYRVASLPEAVQLILKLAQGQPA